LEKQFVTTKNSTTAKEAELMVPLLAPKHRHSTEHHTKFINGKWSCGSSQAEGLKNKSLSRFPWTWWLRASGGAGPVVKSDGKKKAEKDFYLSLCVCPQQWLIKP
jgi:hypothetical protein